MLTAVTSQSIFAGQRASTADRWRYTALWRTSAFLIIGSGLAAALAYWLTQRMIEPIRILEDGVARIGAGQFDHRIDIATGDEFERLATRFNAMAGDLAVSQERSERIGRLKRFLAPQVAELVDHSGDDSVLDGRRIEVVVVFGDLRGFTAFSARAEPNVVMSFLNDYYDALDRVVIDHGATLTHFSGDGMMVLINAPVSRPDPALCAIRMALDMQKTVQSLLRDREPLDHRLGFGVGLALGPATVGRIGTEGRLEYTAVGSVVNLAARLCASARNAEVLIDMAAADAVDGRVPLIERDARVLKGFDKPVRVFAAGEAAAS
ncbi:adenylate/guanylate cyclase domain-containing protein [Bosea eneae]|uniref:Adenylate/guanylate cyclase domain-containing protein n=1 Tax=Bosea eneae TaxID=151454 RepID=A0ABW0IIX2_9HYPH